MRGHEHTNHQFVIIQSNIYSHKCRVSVWNALTCPFMAILTVKEMKSVKSLFSQFGLKKKKQQQSFTGEVRQTIHLFCCCRSIRVYFCDLLFIALKMKAELVKVQVTVWCVCCHLPVSTVWQTEKTVNIWEDTQGMNKDYHLSWGHIVQSVKLNNKEFLDQSARGALAVMG